MLYSFVKKRLTGLLLYRSSFAGWQRFVFSIQGDLFLLDATTGFFPFFPGMQGSGGSSDKDTYLLSILATGQKHNLKIY